MDLKYFFIFFHFFYNRKLIEQSYNLKSNKDFNFEIQSIDINPVMDVIAIISKSSKIYLYVFNFKKYYFKQRVPSFEQLLIIPKNQIGGEYTCSVWSPNGNYYCIGSNKGKISIFNIETGKKMNYNYNLIHNTKITSLKWIEWNNNIVEMYLIK